jgi:hypothetical protein
MIREVDLDGQGQGDIKLLVTFPVAGAPWGDFEFLRGTSWESGITAVTAEAYSHALHGWSVPLRRELGRNPEASAKRVSDKEGHCLQAGACIGWKPLQCRPGGKPERKKDAACPPQCYEAPFGPVASQVALAWREGRYPVIVKGEEFVLS